MKRSSTKIFHQAPQIIIKAFQGSIKKIVSVEHGPPIIGAWRVGSGVSRAARLFETLEIAMALADVMIDPDIIPGGRIGSVAPGDLLVVLVERSVRRGKDMGVE